VILGCAFGILKGAIWILWWLIAPKPVRKERRKVSKSVHRARAKAPKQVKKIRRAARRGKLRRRSFASGGRRPSRGLPLTGRFRP
jgi:hypothetical protein